jgi:3D (Asp-Asp-Asp) domain-containing protein
VAAADPAVLPVGSVVRLHGADVQRYEGIYTVMDTGSAVLGRRIDLYVSDCGEARQFGLKHVLVRVLRLGWNPRASAPPSGGTP